MPERGFYLPAPPLLLSRDDAIVPVPSYPYAGRLERAGVCRGRRNIRRDDVVRGLALSVSTGRECQLVKIYFCVLCFRVSVNRWYSALFR